jgi:hypothetical protein
MKANEIKKEIYNKLVSLNYSRKENDLVNANSINWFVLEDELRNTIMSFPTRPIKFNVDLMSIEDLSGEQQFYLFYSDGNTYLVDTQGYTYPRYIIELEGFDSEDDKFELMEGLLRISDDIIIENAIKSIVIDFSKERFDKDDVETFLQMRIEFLIKKAIASNLNLFQ